MKISIVLTFIASMLVAVIDGAGVLRDLQTDGTGEPLLAGEEACIHVPADGECSAFNATPKCMPYRSEAFCAQDASFPTYIQKRTLAVKNDEHGGLTGNFWFPALDEKLAAYKFAASLGLNPPKIYECTDDIEAIANFTESDAFVIRAKDLHSNYGVYVFPYGFDNMELIRDLTMSALDVVQDLRRMNATTVLVEQYVGSDGGLPLEFKFHMFPNSNGGFEVGSVNVVSNRHSKSCACWAEMDINQTRLDGHGCFTPGGSERKEGECTTIDFDVGMTKAFPMKGMNMCTDLKIDDCLFNDMIAQAKKAVEAIGVYIRVDFFLGSDNKVYVQEFSTNHMNGLRHCSAKIDDNGCIDPCYQGVMWKEAGGDATFGGPGATTPAFLEEYMEASDKCDNIISTPLVAPPMTTCTEDDPTAPTPSQPTIPSPPTLTPASPSESPSVNTSSIPKTDAPSTPNQSNPPSVSTAPTAGSSSPTPPTTPSPTFASESPTESSVVETDAPSTLNPSDTPSVSTVPTAGSIPITSSPTTMPSPVPSDSPTSLPTSLQTPVPSESPTSLPTSLQTPVPSESPTSLPSSLPTVQLPTPVPTPWIANAPLRPIFTGCVGATASWWGDPHFTTFDNHKWDCQGVGEFTIVTNKEADFEVQGRFKSHFERPVALTTSVAFTSGPGSPTVQVSIPDTPSAESEYINGCYVDLYVDGVLRNIDSGSGQNSKVTVERSGVDLSITYIQTSLTITMLLKTSKYYGCHWNTFVCIPETTPGYLTDVIGLLGSPDGDKSNDWMQRDGTAVTLGDRKGSEPTQYCVDNWCIRDQANSLFTYEPGKSLASYDECGNPDLRDVDVSGASQECIDICGADNNPCLIECVVGGIEDAQTAITTQRQSDQARVDSCDESSYQGECTQTGGCQNMYPTAIDCDNAGGGICICENNAVCGCRT